MARQIQINGPTIVRVKFGAHLQNPIPGVNGSLTNAQIAALALPLSGVRPVYSTDKPFLVAESTALSGEARYTDPTGQLYDLGMTTPESLKIIPRTWKCAINVDSQGPNAPAELMNGCAECDVTMTLVHHDRTVLAVCQGESMGGVSFLPQSSVPTGTGAGVAGAEGLIPPPGMLMGNGLLPGESGCHYMSLNLVSILPWRFPTAYLVEQPVVIPLGTKRSLIETKWKAILYQPFSATAQRQTTPFTTRALPGQFDFKLRAGPSRPVHNYRVSPTEQISSGAVLYDHFLDF